MTWNKMHLTWMFAITAIQISAQAPVESNAPTASDASGLESSATATYLESSSTGVLVPLGLQPGPRMDLSPEAHKDLVQLLSVHLGLPAWFGIKTSESKSNDWESQGVSAYIEYTAQNQGGLWLVRLAWKDAGTKKDMFAVEKAIPLSQIRDFTQSFASRVVSEFYGESPAYKTKIAFVQGSGRARDIGIMDWDGASKRMVFSKGQSCSYPSLSPNGSKLYFSCLGSRGPQMYSIQSNGQGVSTLLAGTQAFQPRVSSNGASLLYSVLQEGETDLMLMDLSTQKSRKLVVHPAAETSGDWSFDGLSVVFSSDRGGNPQVYKVDRDGSGLERLTFEGRYNTGASLSPKGDKLAYTRMEGQRMALYVMDLRTKANVLVAQGGNNESPSWSPDGRLIAFSSDRSGKSQVYLVRPDGSGLTQLTSGTAHMHPKWSMVLDSGR